MTRFELMLDDHVKQEADELFDSLGLDTATAIRIFLRASIAHAGIPFSVQQRGMPDECISSTCKQFGSGKKA